MNWMKWGTRSCAGQNQTKSREDCQLWKVSKGWEPKQLSWISQWEKRMKCLIRNNKNGKSNSQTSCGRKWPGIASQATVHLRIPKAKQINLYVWVCCNKSKERKIMMAMVTNLKFKLVTLLTISSVNSAKNGKSWNLKQLLLQLHKTSQLKAKQKFEKKNF